MMNALAPNTMVQDRYLIVHLIGKGGMGEVYLAVDQRLGSAVALKRTSYSNDPALAGAFEREARILARLRHPVLPKVSDHFVDGGNQYLVMEHIAGDDLAARLEAAGKPFPLSWVMFWSDQLLDGLNYLHSHEPPIVHRDIKPQNLKLTDENHIVLLDFGLSKDTHSSHTPGSENAPSIFGYTPHFAPMEQIQGTGTDPRSDLYSLAATLYQLATNIKPIDALTRADAMLNGKPDPVVPMYQANPDIPKGVSDVIMRALEVTKDRRYTNALEMQQELRKAYNDSKASMMANTVVMDSPLIEPVVEAEPIVDAQPVIPTVAPEPSFDATVQMTGGQLPEIPQAVPEQSGIKTEVLLAKDLAEPIADTPPPSPFTFDNVAPAAEHFEPAATVSLISIDNNVQDTGEAFTPPSNDASDAAPATPAFFTEPVININENAAAHTAAETVPEPVIEPEPKAMAAANAATAVPAAPTAAAKTPTAKKKSKAGLILGGLGAVLILMLLAGGGAWYAYSNGMFHIGGKTEPSPTTTPMSTPMPTPTAESTPDQTSNSSLESNTNSSPTPTPVISPTPFGSQPVQTPAVKPTAVPVSTPSRTGDSGSRPPRTPAPRATPKPKTGNDRVVIQQ